MLGIPKKLDGPWLRGCDGITIITGTLVDTADGNHGMAFAIFENGMVFVTFKDARLDRLAHVSTLRCTQCLRLD